MLTSLWALRSPTECSDDRFCGFIFAKIWWFFISVLLSSLNSSYPIFLFILNWRMTVNLKDDLIWWRILDAIIECYELFSSIIVSRFYSFLVSMILRFNAFLIFKNNSNHFCLNGHPSESSLKYGCDMICCTESRSDGLQTNIWRIKSLKIKFLNSHLDTVCWKMLIQDNRCKVHKDIKMYSFYLPHDDRFGTACLMDVRGDFGSIWVGEDFEAFLSRSK